MHMLQTLAQFLTVLSCGLFAGAAVYITLVEHPARMECGTELAATEFRPSYRRAAVMQACRTPLGLACWGHPLGGSHSLYAFGRPAEQHPVAGSVA